MKRYLKRTPPDEARDMILARLGESWGGEESLAVTESRGRILARPVTAVHSSPAYHASAMDGFAVDAGLTSAASEHAPRDLSIGSEVLPVDTGDPLPPGTNAVIMIEDAHIQNDRIRVYRSWSPYENVRTVAEDVAGGEMLLPAGKVMSAYDIGLCLAGGVTRIKARRRPTVGIIPTGDELISPGTLVERGKIVEFNSAVLAALVEESGGVPRHWNIIPDNREQLAAVIMEAMAHVDILVINAGSSAGRDDLTAGIVEEMGELLVHGVAMAPGKPTVLGLIGGKPVVGLPGYPVSAAVAFRRFVAPLIESYLGWSAPADGLEAILSRDLPSKPGQMEYVRGQAAWVAGRLVFNPLPRGAALISAYARANAEASIPASIEGIERGAVIAVKPLAPAAELHRSLLVAGSHDFSLSLLAQELFVPPRLNLLVSTQGSLGGLILLAEGYTHLATCHLLDPISGSYNRPYADRILSGKAYRGIHVARRRQGLMVRKGNPKDISGIADLRRPDLVFVNRQRGSGTRILLDHLLAAEGIASKDISGYGREETTHLTVAAAVASDVADMGLGILPAAVALGLDFIPLTEEIFDLITLEEFFNLPSVQRVRQVLSQTRFREALEAYGGYDARHSGSVY